MRFVYADAGISPAGLPEDLEVVTRHGDDATYLVAVNHGAEDAVLPAAGRELLSGTAVEESFTIPAGGVAVIRTDND